MPGGVQTEVKTYQMFINGEWVASKSAKTFPVYDPSTEEVIAHVPDASSEDVNRAVAAAKAAFEEGPWATTTAIRASPSSKPNSISTTSLRVSNTTAVWPPKSLAT